MGLIQEEFVQLDRGTQRLIEWQYRWAGGFHTKLFELIGKADDMNRARLALSFPEEVAAFNNFSRVKNWWPDLQERVFGLEGRGS